MSFILCGNGWYLMLSDEHLIDVHDGAQPGELGTRLAPADVVAGAPVG